MAIVVRVFLEIVIIIHVRAYKEANFCSPKFRVPLKSSSQCGDDVMYGEPATRDVNDIVFCVIWVTPIIELHMLRVGGAENDKLGTVVKMGHFLLTLKGSDGIMI